MRKEKTAGSILAESRKQKSITLKQVHSDTYISEEALSAFEKNDLSFFSSRLNAEGLAKKYATYLGLDAEYIASLVRRDYIVDAPGNFPSYNIYSVSIRKKFDFWWWSGIFVIFMSLTFFGYQVFLFLLPPKVKITEPSAKSFKRVEKISVKGVVDKESEVFVNGKQANVESDGVFFIDVALKRGKNNIQVQVVGANGKKTDKTIDIVNE